MSTENTVRDTYELLIDTDAELATLRDLVATIERTADELRQRMRALSRAFDREVRPPFPVRAFRQEQGWTQYSLITRISRELERRGSQAPSRENLKTMVSRWENGKHQPSEYYRDVLVEVFARA
jgi:hypothetical protein